jgi:synaptobrevin homolog YKT6
MRLFSITIVRNDVKPAILLASAKDVSTFSFFKRSTVENFMDFFSQAVAERTQAGQRNDIEQNGRVLLSAWYLM